MLRTDDKTSELQGANPLVASDTAAMLQSPVAVELTRPVQGLNTSKEQLRALLAHVNASHEKAKAGFAKTLHDDLSQKLTALLIELSLLENSLPASSVEASKVKELSALVLSISQTVRTLTNDLRLKILDEFGLAAALKHETQRLAKLTGAEITVQVEDLGSRLPGSVGSDVFQIFRLIMEILFASDVSQVQTSVQLKSRHLILRIVSSAKEDAKKPKPNFDETSFDALNVREQVRRLRGSIKFSDVPNEGAVIVVKVPTQQTA